MAIPTLALIRESDINLVDHPPCSPDLALVTLPFFLPEEAAVWHQICQHRRSTGLSEAHLEPDSSRSVLQCHQEHGHQVEEMCG